MSLVQSPCSEFTHLQSAACSSKWTLSNGASLYLALSSSKKKEKNTSSRIYSYSIFFPSYIHPSSLPLGSLYFEASHTIFSTMYLRLLPTLTLLTTLIPSTLGQTGAFIYLYTASSCAGSAYFLCLFATPGRCCGHSNELFASAKIDGAGSGW